MKPRKRSYNTRLIRLGMSYSVQEVSELYRVHKNAVLRWIRDGLATIDGRRPYLIHGAVLAAWLKKKQSARKHKCRSDEFFCCKCRAPRKAWENITDVVIRNESKLALSALCAACGTVLHRIGSVKKLAEYQKIFSIQTIQDERIN
jgi:hypothetical protein